MDTDIQDFDIALGKVNHLFDENDNTFDLRIRNIAEIQEELERGKKPQENDQSQNSHSDKSSSEYLPKDRFSASSTTFPAALIQSRIESCGILNTEPNVAPVIRDSAVKHLKQLILLASQIAFHETRLPDIRASDFENAEDLFRTYQNNKTSGGNAFTDEEKEVPMNGNLSTEMTESTPPNIQKKRKSANLTHPEAQTQHSCEKKLYLKGTAGCDLSPSLSVQTLNFYMLQENSEDEIVQERKIMNEVKRTKEKPETPLLEMPPYLLERNANVETCLNLGTDHLFTKGFRIENSAGRVGLSETKLNQIQQNDGSRISKTNQLETESFQMHAAFNDDIEMKEQEISSETPMDAMLKDQHFSVAEVFLKEQSEVSKDANCNGPDEVDGSSGKDLNSSFHNNVSENDLKKMLEELGGVGSGRSFGSFYDVPDEITLKQSQENLDLVEEELMSDFISSERNLDIPLSKVLGKTEEPVVTNYLDTSEIREAEGVWGTIESKQDSINNEEQPSIPYEWVDYTDMLIKTFFKLNETNSTKRSRKSSPWSARPSAFNDFYNFVHDIEENGFLPALTVWCRFCCKFLNMKFDQGINSVRLHGILNLFEATLKNQTSECLNYAQVKEIFAVFIEIILIAPDCDVNKRLVATIGLVSSFVCIGYQRRMINGHLFIFDSQGLLMRAKDEALLNMVTWICSFITESLHWFMNDSFHDLNIKCRILHISLLLANQLEQLGCHLAHEFEWHWSILKALQQYNSVVAEELESQKSDCLPETKKVKTKTDDHISKRKEKLHGKRKRRHVRPTPMKRGYASKIKEGDDASPNNCTRTETPDMTNNNGCELINGQNMDQIYLIKNSVKDSLPNVRKILCSFNNNMPNLLKLTLKDFKSKPQQRFVRSKSSNLSYAYVSKSRAKNGELGEFDCDIGNSKSFEPTFNEEHTEREPDLREAEECITMFDTDGFKFKFEDSNIPVLEEGESIHINIENALLLFLKSFFQHYTGILQPGILAHIHFVISSQFGERLTYFVSTPDMFSLLNIPSEQRKIRDKRQSASSNYIGRRRLLLNAYARSFKIRRSNSSNNMESTANEINDTDYTN